MINHELRMIFVHIQKTGGAAVNTAFGMNLDCPEKHFTAKELKALYGEKYWNEYFKFAFVRNPWDRLVSWWTVIDRHRNSGIDLSRLNNFRRYVLNNATTFEEFLLNCSEEIEDKAGKKYIYQNQIDYIIDKNNNIMIDFIGKFENISDDFHKISKRILGKSLELPHISQSKHDHYSKYYTPKLTELVRSHYSRDIESFDYKF